MSFSGWDPFEKEKDEITKLELELKLLDSKAEPLIKEILLKIRVLYNKQIVSIIESGGRTKTSLEEVITSHNDCHTFLRMNHAESYEKIKDWFWNYNVHYGKYLDDKVNGLYAGFTYQEFLKKMNLATGTEIDYSKIDFTDKY